MSTTAPANTALRFKRNTDTGCYNATVVSAPRNVYEFGDGTAITREDRITFRVCPQDEWSEKNRRFERVGYRCIIFVNGEILFDDKGRECDKLAMAKAYLARLADTDEARWKAEAMLNETGRLGHDFYPMSRHHDAFMLALDDFYGEA